MLLISILFTLSFSEVLRLPGNDLNFKKMAFLIGRLFSTSKSMLLLDTLVVNLLNLLLSLKCNALSDYELLKTLKPVGRVMANRNIVLFF